MIPSRQDLVGHWAAAGALAGDPPTYLLVEEVEPTGLRAEHHASCDGVVGGKDDFVLRTADARFESADAGAGELILDFGTEVETYDLVEDPVGLGLARDGEIRYRKVDLLVETRLVRRPDGRVDKILHAVEGNFARCTAATVVVSRGQTLMLRYQVEGDVFLPGDAWLTWNHEVPDTVALLRVSDTVAILFDHDPGRPGSYDFTLHGESGDLDPTLINKADPPPG